MEHKVGTRITLEVVESKYSGCTGCFFEDVCNFFDDSYFECEGKYRHDGKSIIYKEIKEE